MSDDPLESDETVKKSKRPRRPNINTKERRFLAAIMDWILSYLPTEFVKYLKKEIGGVKHGWHVFTLILLIAAVGAVWGSGRFYYSPKFDDLGTTSENRIKGLKTANEKLTEEKREVTAERDKYFVSLQPWQSLAAGIYTNLPPAEQLKMLSEQFTSISNVVVQLIESQSIDLSLYVNGLPITNDLTSIILEEETESVNFVAKNTGQVGVPKIIGTLIFRELSSSNIITEKWIQDTGGGPVIEDDAGNLKFPKGFTTYRSSSPNSIANGDYFLLGSITFTNLSKPMIDMQLSVFSTGGIKNSKVVTIFLNDASK